MNDTTRFKRSAAQAFQIKAAIDVPEETCRAVISPLPDVQRDTDQF
jgi:hypothetical protein